MIKRIAHIVLSAWLAIILLFGSTPKEFVHLFAHHKDTVHAIHEKDGLVLEPEHHHCTFLSFALPFFVNDNAVIRYSYHKQTYPVYHTSVVNSCYVATIFSASLRGPPVA